MTRNLSFAAAFAAFTLSGVSVFPTAAAASAQDAQPQAAAAPARSAMSAKMSGLITLIGVLAPPDPVRAESDLEGTYVASGVKPDRSRYRTVVQIATDGTVSEETLTKLPRKLEPSKEFSSIRRR